VKIAINAMIMVIVSNITVENAEFRRRSFTLSRTYNCGLARSRTKPSMGLMALEGLCV